LRNKNKNKNELEMESYEITCLLEQIDEQKDHMIVAMNILMFLIRHQVVILDLSQSKDSQLSWDKSKLNSLCSQARRLGRDEEDSSRVSTRSSYSESLSTETNSCDIEIIK